MEINVLKNSMEMCGSGGCFLGTSQVTAETPQANCGQSFSSLQSQRERASGLGELWFGGISEASTTESSRGAHLAKPVSLNRLTGLSWF
ncbi:hypothetical protein EK904_013546 [Melospiza melodia maxima]|nr:hypothetical protein EK904_013546 [Melospiza melodia maxima]